jgi:hypothetical protein
MFTAASLAGFDDGDFKLEDHFCRSVSKLSPAELRRHPDPNKIGTRVLHLSWFVTNALFSCIQFLLI